VPVDEEAARKAGRYDKPGEYSSITVADVPNDLAFLVGVRRRIRLQSLDNWGIAPDPTEVNGPRGLAVVGNKAYAAIYFSDAVTAVDLEPKPGKVVTRWALGPKPELTVARRGEINFHDASLCFQHWQSCASCHPDARVDGLNWDLMNDGLGNPKNNKSMLLAHKTPSAMSTGIRATAEEAVRSGITHIQFAVRPEEDAVAIDEYLKALEPVPSPHLVDGRLSESAERGKVLFFTERLKCAECHPAPLYTDQKLYDVGTGTAYDRRDTFDTPSLIECWRTAPYNHDGHYTSVKDLLTTGKHGRTAGSELDSLSEQELNDLIEFVLSL
jgi:cytochrome c peroxidase